MSRQQMNRMHRWHKSLWSMSRKNQGNRYQDRGTGCGNYWLRLEMKEKKKVLTKSCIKKGEICVLYNVFTAWCYAESAWSTSKSSSDSCNCHQSRLLQAFPRSFVHLSELSSERILKIIPSWHVHSSNTAYIVVEHLLCFVSYASLAQVSEREQYLIGVVFLTGCSFNATHSTWTLLES